MRIAVDLAFSDRGAVRLLNWLAQEDAIILRQQQSLPLLYDSGVVYRRETDGEIWRDVINTLAVGHEDCDALAAWRAGELLARGWRALGAGDAGLAEARRLRPKSIRSEVFLTTRSKPGQPGLYHCVTKYEIGGRWYRDDPSARLGMRAGRIDPHVQARWSRLRVRPVVSPLEA